MNKIHKFFEKNEDEYLKFDKVENKLASSPDVHAFILIDKLMPSKNGTDMICSSHHDMYFISVDADKLFKKATEEQMVELIRCGLVYEEMEDSFCFYT